MARFFENQMFKKKYASYGYERWCVRKVYVSSLSEIFFESFESKLFSKTSSKVRRVVKFQQQEYLTFIFILDQISYYWVWNVKVSTGTSHIFDLRTWLTRRATIWFASVDGYDVEKDYEHTCCTLGIWRKLLTRLSYDLHVHRKPPFESPKVMSDRIIITFEVSMKSEK